MEGTRRKRPVWKSVKRRLKGIFTGFCGSSMALRATDNMSAREEEEEEEEEALINAMHAFSDFCHIGPIPVGGGMNLATALAVERQLGNAGNRTDMPPLKSLVRLFEEMDDADLKKDRKDLEDDGGRVGRLCCLCMRRDKGAALITCGHTYCRACSRDLWLNQGSCPLCNRSIIEILDIF